MKKGRESIIQRRHSNRTLREKASNQDEVKELKKSRTAQSRYDSGESERARQTSPALEDDI